MLPVISPQEAFERFSKGEARLVDIRETDEYTQEFVPGSRLIPLSIIAKHPLKDADAPDKPIVFFCHSGNRTVFLAVRLCRRRARLRRDFRVLRPRRAAFAHAVEPALNRLYGK